MKMNTYIQTLGCKVNRYDSDALSKSMLSEGFDLTTEKEQADLLLINSCSVTATAEKEARYLARRFKASKPEGKVAVTGCYAQTDGATLLELDYVDFVIPNAQKENAPAILKSALSGSNPLVSHAVDPLMQDKLVRGNKQGHFKSSLEMFDTLETKKSRAFLKVQDGCNSFCTYCLIPYARGKSRSLQPEKIVAEVQRLVETGFQEIVFTGIHIGDFGKDLPVQEQQKLAGRASKHGKGFEHPIANLLTVLFLETDIRSIRLSSLEPGEISSDLLTVLELYADRVCAHFHLPLQSGSDPVLKRMRRSYNTSQYKNGHASLRNIFKDACFGADIMPGFPGESEEDHKRSLDFVQEIGLDYLHVFPYSKRPNTAAVRMPDHVDPLTKKQRATELRGLSKKLERLYAGKFMGSSLWGILEQGKDRVMTQNNLRIRISNPDDSQLVGSRVFTNLRGFDAKGELVGTI